MKKKEIKTVFYEFSSIKELETDDQILVKEAKKIVKNAYSPYSKFSVGAAVQLENGKIIRGTNQENAAYPSGICAERVAIFYANSKFPDVAVSTIAIAAYTNSKFTKKPIPPCGACRQVLLETENKFGKNIRVLLVGDEKILLIENIKALLPFTFNKDFLE